MSLTHSTAHSTIEESASSSQDLQMTSYSTEGAVSRKAVNVMLNLKSGVDPQLSSTAPVFSGANIGSIRDCTLQIFHGNARKEASNRY